MASRNQRLNATVNIGGALSQSFRGAMSSSRRQIGQVGDAIKQLKTRERRLSKVGDHWEKMGRDAGEYRREIERVNSQIGRLRRSEERLGRVVSAQRANLANRSALRGQMFDAVAIGATAAAPLALAVRFQKSMVEVGAVAQSTDAEMVKLTQTARHLGSTTEFTATQAAEGMKLLGQAGYRTTQIIDAMPGVLDLAAASNTALGKTSDVVSNVLSGFNLEARETGRVGDLLTNGFTTANTNLSQLGDALSYVGPVAADAGVSLAQATAAIGKLSDAGIQGTRAGTALRAIISRIASPTGKAADTIAELGVKTKDANGDLRSLPSILADMNKAMRGMGSAARADVTSTVFGLEAASAASVLLGKAGAGELDTYADSLGALGSAARIAKAQNDNAAGSLVRLKSAGEGIAITLGSLLLPAITDAAQGVATVTNRVDEIAQRFPLATKAIVGATLGLAGLKIGAIAGGYAFTFLRGGALSLVGALYRTQAAAAAAEAGTKAATAGPTMLGRAMLAVGPASKVAVRSLFTLRGALISTGIGAIAVGIGAAAGLIYKYWEPLGSFFRGLLSGIGSAMTPVVERFGHLLDRLGPVGSGIRAVGGAIGDAIGWFVKLFAPVDAGADKLDSFAQTGQRVGQIVGRAFASLANVIGQQIDSIIDKFAGIGQVYNKVAGWLGFDGAGSDAPSSTSKPMKVGDAERARPVYRPSSATSESGPAVPLRRAESGSGAVDARQTVNLTINQQPGENSDALADRAVEKMKEHERRERRSALFDNGPAYGY